MEDHEVSALPEYCYKVLPKELQGTTREVTYPVYNYINEKRQLVTNQKITASEAGRETVKGDAIHKKCIVYLPAGYDRERKDQKYNILYLLHGVGGNRYEWLSGTGKSGDYPVICSILDYLIAGKNIDPLIVVFPDSRSTYDWTDTSFHTEGTNILGFYYFDYELRYDLMPFIEAEYRTYADVNDRYNMGIEYNRHHRAIAGLSMGGMQALNLILGGYRHDSVKYTGGVSSWDNGLEATVPAPGMLDQFAYVGAFSNAPTSSTGTILGNSLASCAHKLEVLYLTCGDADGVAYHAGFETAVTGLREEAGEQLVNFYRHLMKEGKHDFEVWNHGAYEFLRLIFRNATSFEQKLL